MDSADDTTDHLFKHDPLDPNSQTIRIVRILPGPSHSSIFCELSPVDLSAEYRCLSYVWGSGETKCLIYIDKRPFWIRRNLWDFLWRARERGIDGLLWIDALCIDQSNVTEKNHQVRLMARIYQDKSVYIWLGTGDDELEAFLSNHQRRVWYPGANYQAFRNMLARLSTLPYWTRLWVMQEVILSDECYLLYGTVQLPLAQLRKLQISGDSSPMLDLSDLWKTYRRTGRSGFPLGMLLNTTEARECEDPRDRIYGLLGLASDTQDFAVDYEESTKGLMIRLLTDVKIVQVGDSYTSATDVGLRGIFIIEKRFFYFYVFSDLTLPSFAPIYPRDIPTTRDS